MQSSPQQNISHRFIAIDEGLGTLLHVDERQPARDWRVPIGFPQARDLQLVGNGRILVGHHHGYTEFDLETGAVARTFSGLEGVTAVRRQADGSTLVAGVNLAGKAGVTLLTLDVQNQVRSAVVFAGDYVRLLRQTAEGTLLMCCNDRIREGTLDGVYIREFPVEGFYHAWKAVRLESGNLLVSAGYGAFLVELDPQGRVVRKFGGKGAVPESVNPFFYAMFQRLPNRHIVLANWQGHGPDHGKSGVQLLEFDEAGEIVWQWSDATRISSLQGILVLDNLDLTRIHEETTGTLQPLPL
jgi:hypothetical protein